MKNMFERRPECCYIELEPKLTKDKKWTGQLEINILTAKDNPMQAESRLDLIHLCQLVASTVALMEVDYDLADRLEEFMAEKEDENIVNTNKKMVDITHGEGNIVHLSFTSKVKGNS